MKLGKYILAITFLFSALSGFAQIDSGDIDPMLINFKARVISATDSSAVPYANVINNRTHSGTITNSDGYFTLEMLNIDSLVITSIGYEKSVLKVPRNYSEYNVHIFVINPIAYQVGEVKVQGERPKIDLGLETGKPVDISPELRGDAFNERPPVIAALFNPISYWQYYLGKREKQKRRVREAISLEKNWEMHSKNYNKEKVMSLTGLDEIEADTFMIWFNSQNILPYTSTEYQVRASIIEYFRLYKLEKMVEE